MYKMVCKNPVKFANQKKIWKEKRFNYGYECCLAETAGEGRYPQGRHVLQSSAKKAKKLQLHLQET
jgi:hypothetical protein